jgi:hypothetical protein
VRIETSIIVAATPEHIWPTLARVTAWPVWLPTVIRVEALDRPELAPGARFRVSQPRLRAAVWTVTEVAAPRNFRWESRSPGVLVVADHSIEPLSDRESRVTLGIEFSGLGGVVAGWLYGSLTRSYVAREAEALKRTVETALAQSAAGAAR